MKLHISTLLGLARVVVNRTTELKVWKTNGTFCYRRKLKFVFEWNGGIMKNWRFTLRVDTLISHFDRIGRAHWRRRNIYKLLKLIAKPFDFSASRSQNKWNFHFMRNFFRLRLRLFVFWTWENVSTICRTFIRRSHQFVLMPNKSKMNLHFSDRNALIKLNDLRRRIFVSFLLFSDETKEKWHATINQRFVMGPLNCSRKCIHAIDRLIGKHSNSTWSISANAGASHIRQWPIICRCNRSTSSSIGRNQNGKSSFIRRESHSTWVDFVIKSKKIRWTSRMQTHAVAFALRFIRRFESKFKYFLFDWFLFLFVFCSLFTHSSRVFSSRMCFVCCEISLNRQNAMRLMGFCWSHTHKTKQSFCISNNNDRFAFNFSLPRRSYRVQLF